MGNGTLDLRPSWQARHANTTNKYESNNYDNEDEHDNNQDNAESGELRYHLDNHHPETNHNHNQLLPPNLPNEYMTQFYGSTILNYVK